MEEPCPRCGCRAAGDGGAHRLQHALMAMDPDAAIQAGLLEATACAGCSDGCNTALRHARDARLFALAARERYRARELRLQRRRAERDAARRAPARQGDATGAGDLPPAAADALARALARARERRR